MNRTRDFRSEAPDLKALVLIDMQRCSLPEAPFGVPRMHEVVRSALGAMMRSRFERRHLCASPDEPESADREIVLARESALTKKRRGVETRLVLEAGPPKEV
jgi:hypothetical protein